MLPKPTDPNRLDDQDGTVAPAEQWAARLARLDLDAESVEIIMAALTADVCDDISTVDAS